MIGNDIRITLTKREIDSIFKRRNPRKWFKLLDAYLFLRENIERADHADIFAEYQKKFNYFYQVRRNAGWRAKFYELFSRHAQTRNADFASILKSLHEKTGMVEASFASKFAATINPDLPLIDRHVLSHIGRKLPPSGRRAEERIPFIIALHSEMQTGFAAFLKSSAAGKHLVDRFTAEFEHAKISPMKMLDFVLWQSGGAKK